MMTVLFASVYIGDYLVLTVMLDGSLHAAFNCTNSTKQRCAECNPGSFANQSMSIFYLILSENHLSFFWCNVFLIEMKQSETCCSVG